MPIGRFPFVLLFLACWSAARAAEEPQPDKWEKAIAKFEEQDKAAPPPRGEVLFAGSSSIVQWKLKEFFPGKEYINRGFGGSQIADSTRHAGRIITPCQPRLIVLYAGDNDVAGGKTPEQVAADYKAFVAAVRGKLPETKIVFVAIKPSLARWKLVDKVREANRLVAEYSKTKRGLLFLDVFTPMLGSDGLPRGELFVKDGLHMTPEGYKLWTSLLAPLLEAGAGKGATESKGLGSL
jgi:lysophospholipase L1-like esterase